MTYEFAQSALTVFIQAIVVGSVCIFAAAAHCDALDKMRAKAQTGASLVAASEATEQPLPVETTSDTLNFNATERQMPEPAQSVAATSIVKLHVVPDALVAEADTFDKEAEREGLRHLNTTQLRKECSRCQIKWRNAHGQGKHLRKPEMITALLDKLAQSSPTPPTLATA